MQERFLPLNAAPRERTNLPMTNSRAPPQLTPASSESVIIAPHRGEPGNPRVIGAADPAAPALRAQQTPESPGSSPLPRLLLPVSRRVIHRTGFKRRGMDLRAAMLKRPQRQG